jgi:hypothetical protein
MSAEDERDPELAKPSAAELAQVMSRASKPQKLLSMSAERVGLHVQRWKLVWERPSAICARLSITAAEFEGQFM